MVPILRRGSEDDPESFKFFTGSNRFIENERPDTERAPDALRAARTLFRGIYPNVECRSLTGMYNCVGMVFATRRTAVSPDHLPQILRDDGYRTIAEANVFVGDIVIYKRAGNPQHVGIIYEFRDISPAHDGSLREMFVLSQWGQDGEYLHRLRDVPTIYGTELEFWTERRLG
jgi:hypothetical protein